MKNLYIGLMSGTSVDAVDAVLVEFFENDFIIHESHSIDFPKDLQTDIQHLLSSFQINLLHLGHIDHRLGLLYADCVNELLEKSEYCSEDILAIGCHGQTIYHSPDSSYPFSTQIGDANKIVSLTGIDVVSDFRRMDLANGGQGAPLTPLFHCEMLMNRKEKQLILNLGGIANISILREQNLLGFDTGPANCLMDLWIQKNLGKKYDENGAWAKSGTVHQALLQDFLKDEYFSKEIPKSTGKELFNMLWLDKYLCNYPSLSLEDIQASLLELTVQSIADSLQRNNLQVEIIYVCGGGAKNKFLLERLATVLDKTRICNTSCLGIDPKLVEATAFAWLAYQRIQEIKLNCMSITGAKYSSVLGALYKS